MTKLVIESLGGYCPVQGFGTLDSERFYFRYRHDDAQLEVGPSDPHNPEMPTVRLYAELTDVSGVDDRGWLDRDEATALLWRLIALLRPVEDWSSTYADRLSAAVENLIQQHRDRHERAPEPHD